MNLEHTTVPLRPLPAHADLACYTGSVAEPCSDGALSDDAPHAVPAGPPHMTRRNHRRCDGAVPRARPAGERLPTQRVGSSSEDRLGLEGDQAEAKAADRQGQMQTDHPGVWECLRVPGRPADRLCH